MKVINIEVITRIPTDYSKSCNGGDYEEGYTIKGYKKNRKSKPYFTCKFFTSCEFLEGEFSEYKISHKEVKKILLGMGIKTNTILSHFGKCWHWELKDIQN